MASQSKAFCSRMGTMTWDKFIAFFEKVGRAKAAAELRRQGYNDLANRLLSENG